MNGVEQAVNIYTQTSILPQLSTKKDLPYLCRMGIRGGEAMDFDPRLADNIIQEILEKRGMTQKELALRLRTYYRVKIYQSDISEIINGRVKNLTLIRAAAFSMALGYSIEAIWPSLFKK